MSRELPPWENGKQKALDSIKKGDWKAVDEMLRNNAENTRNGAIFALWQCVDEKKDIAPAIPALLEIIKVDTGMAAKVIDYHFINKKDKKKFAEMFDDKEINEQIIGAIWTIILEHGADVSFIEDLLIKKLSDSDYAIRSYAATDLAHHYSNKNKFDKVMEFLKSDAPEVRMAAEVELDGVAQFKDKKTAQRIIDAIEKAKIDKKRPEIAEIIRKCRENEN